MNEKECRFCGAVIREGDETAVDHDDVHAGCADANGSPASSGLKRATKSLGTYLAASKGNTGGR
jgi:hypothetical protein